MDVRLDHLIVPVNDLGDTLAFYRDVLGFRADGMHGPFTVVRVSADLILLFAQFATPGGFHMAFSFGPDRFDRIVSDIRANAVPYGDRFDRADNGAGPAPQPGATGEEPGIYLLDPSGHLIELRRSSIT